MPTRSRTTFKKRQKELARMEKQRDKVARRMQRKLGLPGEPAPEATDDLSTSPDDLSASPDDSSPAPDNSSTAKGI